MRVRAAIPVVLLSLMAVGNAEARTSVAGSFRIPTVEDQRVEVDVSAGWITVTASVPVEAGDGFEAAIYETKGTIEPRRFTADLGRFGTIDLRFERDEVHRATEGGCELIKATGTFRGQATYLGEGSLAAAAANRIRGAVTIAKGAECRIHLRERDDRSPRATVLTGVERDATSSLIRLFTAIRFSDVPGTLLSAQDFASEGRLFIAHIATVQGPRGAFTFNRSLTRASLSPPAPFAGAGTFERSGDQRLWSGDLAVSIVGLEPVSLTTPGTRVRLRRVAVGEGGWLAQLARYAGKYPPVSRSPPSSP